MLKIIRAFEDDAQQKEALQTRAWFLAARRGNLEMLEVLAEKGVDINLPIRGIDLIRDGFSDGLTAVDYAIRGGHSQCLRWMLGQGARTKGRSPSQRPIDVAAGLGHLDCVAVLLEHGHRPHSECPYMPDSLAVAAFEGHAEIMRFLLREVTPGRRYLNSDKALLSACQGDHPKCVRTLLDVVASPNPPWCLTTCLCKATRNCNIEIMEMLLKSGANVNGDHTSIPLIIASKISMPQPDQAYEFDNNIFLRNPIAAVKLLLKYKADINKVDEFHNTALTAAAQHGRLEVVRSLLNEEFNVNHKCFAERTALHFAASAGRFDIVNILIKADADPNLKDRSEFTPMAAALHQRGITLREGHIKVVKSLLKAGSTSHWDDTVHPGAHPVYLASCTENHMRVLHILIQAGGSRKVLWKVGSHYLYQKERDLHVQKLLDLTTNPSTLLGLARTQILKSFISSPSKCIDVLPLPDMIKKYINFSDIDNM